MSPLTSKWKPGPRIPDAQQSWVYRNQATLIVRKLPQGPELAELYSGVYPNNIRKCGTYVLEPETTEADIKKWAAGVWDIKIRPGAASGAGK